MENKRKWRRVLPVLLAAVLWIEGTLGTAYASEQIPQEVPVADAGQTTGEGEANLTEDDREIIPSDSTDKPVMEESGNGQSAEEEGKETAPGTEDGSGEEESRNLEGGENVPGSDGTEMSGEEGDTAPGQPEIPDEGEETVPGGTEEPDGAEDEPAGEETDALTEELDPSVERPAVSENTVSENMVENEDDELPDDWSGEPTLGEPPLMTEAAGGYAVYSNNGISTMAEGIKRQTPSVVDIIERYKEYPWSLSVSNSYSVTPSAKTPYRAGHLENKSLENALNLLNFIRYVAGLPAEVELSEDYTEKAQAGALLNRVNGKLDHEPTKPEGFPDDLYETGNEGCLKSNIAAGYGNLAKSLLNGWMYDGAASNLDRMANRRLILNPAMEKTGFGAVDSYAAMYVRNSEGSSITDYVAWPAQNMPIELMNGSGTPWTLSLGSDYEKANFQEASVTLKDVVNNKSWTFSGSNANGVFKVNVEYYGMPNCIIFRPNNVSYNKNSQFQVTVTGIKTKDGEPATISYNVDFFSLSDTPKVVQNVTLDREELHLLLDEEGKNKGTLHAAVTPSNAVDQTLVWRSLDETVATVDENGVVTAVGVGDTTVTVTAENGKQAACAIKISTYTLAADGIAFDEETDTYSLAFALQGDNLQGDARKLTVRDGEKLATDKIQWSSENKNVAAVDADGVVTPAGVGEATIWANVDNGLKILSCEVKVENIELPFMQMQKSSYTMKKDDTGELRVYLSPADTKWGNGGQKYIKWKSDDADTVAFVVKNEEGMTTIASETVSGNTVTVMARVAGTTRITAEIVDETGQPVGDSSEEKGKASCEVMVQETASLPAEADGLCRIALTNTQKTLGDIKLPDGWKWKYPDTSLTQFSGQRSKTFPAEYCPSEDVQPKETLLPVYFLTLENITVRVKHRDDVDVLQDVSILKSGWVSHCYVNYSFEETLEQFEEKYGELKNNAWYQNEKKELLAQMEKSVALTSSRPQTVRVESVENGEGKTALSALTPGDAVLKAELKLGAKTFRASQKLTVTETVGTGFKVTWLDHFGASGEGEPYRYTAELSDFATAAPGGINSKIRLEMTGVTKLTVKSSNSKVVALKSTTVKPTETVKFEIPLMVRAAGTAEITVTGNDPAKTSHTLRLVVTDACPGLSEETVTVNTWRTVGTDFCLYAAKDAAGAFYSIKDVSFEKGGQHSSKFVLTGENAQDGSRRDCSIMAKSDTKAGSYKVRLYVEVGDKVYYLPLTIKVVSTKPKCSVKQKNKLNLFYEDTKSLLTFDTEEKIEYVRLVGCNYLVELSNQGDGYYLSPGLGATLNSVKKGNLKIKLEGWRELEVPFNVGVEKKALKISPEIGTVTLYPKNGLTTARIGIKNAETLPWEDLRIAGFSAKAKGNYEPKLQQEERAVLLQGKNLNQAESIRITIQLRSENWTESVNLVCNVKVNLKEPAITLQNRTLQLNSHDDYKGFDAASTGVRWKGGGDILTTQGVRVSVYCDPKDAKAKALVQNSQVVFSVKNAQVSVRLNNKAVASGTYKYIVQAAKEGQIWKTPLTLKVVNTAPEKAVKMTAKGSIDVLNRDDSFMTLTPSLKAVSGEFVIPEGREVKLAGRDAHLFRASWSEDGKTIELRAKRNETLVIKYQYTVTPLLTLRNVYGVTEEITAPAVKFKVKQGSARVSASPKTAFMYSSAYNSVEIDMNAALKGAHAPEVERVVLTGNTDAFTYVYNKEGKGTLTMKDTGRAVKGKNYSLQFKVSFAEQADNVKPVTVRYTVKVK